MRPTFYAARAKSRSSHCGDRSWIASAIFLVLIVVVPPSALAQFCGGNLQVGCASPGAVCSPVESGVGPKGKCTSVPGLPPGERECDCVGAPPLNLTGTWLADDGGIYYMRQIGNQLWWAGFSTESPGGVNDLHKGLAFTNVFAGEITGNTASGNWADVPRGQILQNGTLTLTVSNGVIERQGVTGGFGATQWNRTNPDPPPVDIFTIFQEVKKNQNAWRDHSLLDNLKPAKALPVAIFGTVEPAAGDPDPMHVGYLSTYGRTYHDFICLNGNDSPPDADIDFNILVDRQNLNQQIGFWTDGWETSHSVNPTNFGNKLNEHNLLHLESIMYGGTTECGDSGATAILLPGWQQAGSTGVLFNGVPIAGQMDITDRNPSSARINSILGRPIPFGTRVRVSGNLVLDCGHGWTHPCHEDEAGYQNQEVHPIYALDVVQNFQLQRPLALLTGAWSSDDAGTYYLRQIGTTVWWLGLSSDEGRSFANVFLGTLQNNQLSGNWADVPLGQTENAGTLAMTAGSGQLSTSLTRTAVTGGFGGNSWEKLYDAGSSSIIVIFDSATTSAAAWPSTSVPVPFEIVVGSQRIEAQPTNPHTVKLPSGQQVTQVDLNARMTVDPPQLGPLRATASFVGYRTSWTITESDRKPGGYQRAMKSPRALPVRDLQIDETLVADRDAEAAKIAARQPAAPVPDLVIHYHIEQVNSPQ